MVGRLASLVVGLAMAAGVGTLVALERMRRTWGRDADDAVKQLPGDGVVPDATVSDTWGITVDAPAAAIWPWLVQMGYGRGGWYSYDALDADRPSATSIVPALQDLEVGDVVPTHPDGGFVVAEIEADRSLVLRIDDALVAQQARNASERGGPAPTPPGVAASGTLLSSMPSNFEASWAFVLEPIDGDRTRLIERFRATFGSGGAAWAAAGPLFGIGVFVMVRRQMLGIKDRAERLRQEASETTARTPVEPVRTGVPAPAA